MILQNCSERNECTCMFLYMCMYLRLFVSSLRCINVTEYAFTAVWVSFSCDGNWVFALAAPNASQSQTCVLIIYLCFCTQTLQKCVACSQVWKTTDVCRLWVDIISHNAHLIAMCLFLPVSTCVLCMYQV